MISDRRVAVRQRLLDLAAADPAVTGAAITGSDALQASDSWSDVDLAFGIDNDDLGPTLARWTKIMTDEFGCVHHWDLPSGEWIYRVFLLPDGLEVDLGFVRSDVWGPRAASWRTVFGDPAPPDEAATVEDQRTSTGLAWHHVRQAHTAIERGQPLRADYWIAATRSLVIEWASRRHGLPTSYAKGAHLLPADLHDRLATSIPRSVEASEQRRALRAITAELVAQLEIDDPDSVRQLQPVLASWVS